MPLSAPLINDSDLTVYMPDVLSFGTATFLTQCTLASDDIYERLLNEWWPNALGNYFGFTQERVDLVWPVLPLLDENYLNKAALTQITVYRALSHYIMPMLASDADANGDLFTRRAARYNTFYNEEWKKIVRMALYDFNKDAVFQNRERPQRMGRRLVRA